MNDCAWLKRSHLIDIQVWSKSAKNEFGEKEIDTELNGNFEDNCLFIGVMPEEDDPRKAKPKLLDDLKTISMTQEDFKVTYDPVIYIEEQLIGTYGNYSPELINQIKVSVHRYNHYISEPDAIR